MLIRLNKYGFTLIETLIVLACVPLLLLIMAMTLKVMTNTHVHNIDPIDVFKIQLKQSLNRAAKTEFLKDSLTYDYNNQNYLIERDGNRLVRRPGYEILLEPCTHFKAQDTLVEVCNDEKCIEV